MRDDDVIPSLPLPRYVERVTYEVPTHMPPWSAGAYLLERLSQGIPPLLPLLEEPMLYGASYKEGKLHALKASDRGLLLLDRVERRPSVKRGRISGARLYLRSSGYALLWCEGRGDAWQGVVRHLKLHEAVAAFGGLAEIVRAMGGLSRRLAQLSRHPRMGRRAAELAGWCRAVVRDLGID